jgi:phosphate transport system substrate-binding protein
MDKIPSLIRRTLLASVLVLTSLYVPAQSGSSAARASDPVQTLRVHGSNTIGATLAPALVVGWLQTNGWRDIQKRVPAFDELTITASQVDGRRIQVELKAHGTSTGIKDLMAGTCDVAMASRAVKAEERSQFLRQYSLDLAQREHVIALDGVAVVVHPNNPLNTADLATLRAIFTGQQSNWATVNGVPRKIRVLARDAQSGTFDAFKALVLEGADVAASVERFESNRAIALEVAKDIDSIGILSLSEIAGTKALAINGGGARAELPSMASVAVEDYPLTRRLSLFTRAGAPKFADDFVRYALNNEAQQTVDKSGFVNLSVRALDATSVANASTDYLRFVQGAKRLSVNFRFENSVAIFDNRAQVDLFRLAGFLKLNEHRGGVLKLAGFTDNSLKKPALAVSMSEVWAEFVADGLGRSQVRVQQLRGFGAAMPVADNASARGRELNRRVEVWWVPAAVVQNASPRKTAPNPDSVGLD